MLTFPRYTCLFYLIFVFAACVEDATPSGDDFEISTTEEEMLIERLAPYLPESRASQMLIDEKLLIEFILEKKWDVNRADFGYYYQIINAGEGQQPKWGDRLRVHYNVYQLDGQIIDSTYKSGKPFSFYLGNVISGWNDALPRLGVGGKILLLLPSTLAYAEEGLGSLVPPNTCLIFEIELLEVMK